MRDLSKPMQWRFLMYNKYWLRPIHMCTQCSKIYLEISMENSGTKEQFWNRRKNLASAVVQVLCPLLEFFNYWELNHTEKVMFVTVDAPGVSKTSDFSSDWWFDKWNLYRGRDIKRRARDIEAFKEADASCRLHWERLQPPNFSPLLFSWFSPLLYTTTVHRIPPPPHPEVKPI